MHTRQIGVRSLLKHGLACWLLSLFLAAMIVVALAAGAMIWPPVAIALIGPGGLLGLGVVMTVGVLGLTSWLEALFGLEGPAIYMLVSVAMGILFWWVLILTILLRSRRRLRAQGSVHL